ncbi:MAG TPA: 16S rRNA (uracil(1498)-N(3))-methyltransferase [Candidatus Kapabacteria bacterium]
MAKSYGAEVASLGVRRLRAETAAIAACAIALA